MQARSPRLLRIADAVDLLTDWLGHLATALLLSLVALLFYNVISRYLFGGTTVWLQETEWHLMVPIALLGVTVLMRENGHVRVDMLYERYPTRVKHAVDLTAMILGTLVAVMFIRYSYGFVESAWAIREGSADPGGLPGRYWLKSLLPACFVLLALQCAANACRQLAALLDTGRR